LSQRRERLDTRLSKRTFLAAALAVGCAFVNPAQAFAPTFHEAIFTPKRFAEYSVANKVQYACLIELWEHESHWNPKALNKSSGAYGIPQFLPTTWGNYKYPFKPKDPQIQIKAGLRYITVRYGTPCRAWKFWKRHGWY
jgi:soluble lytic murein transglycosylase-like protein